MDKIALLRVEFRVVPRNDGEMDLVRMMPAVLRVPVEDDEVAALVAGTAANVTVRGTVVAIVPG